MICKKCKKEIPETARICANCGEVIIHYDKTEDKNPQYRCKNCSIKKMKTINT